MLISFTLKAYPIAFSLSSLGKKFFHLVYLNNFPHSAKVRDFFEKEIRCAHSFCTGRNLASRKVNSISRNWERIWNDGRAISSQRTRALERKNLRLEYRQTEIEFLLLLFFLEGQLSPSLLGRKSNCWYQYGDVTISKNAHHPILFLTVACSPLTSGCHPLHFWRRSGNPYSL